MTPITCRVMILVILAGLAPLGSSTRASSMMPQCRFDPDGYFYIKGASPAGFAEFDHIQLQLRDESGRRPALDSHLDVKNEKSYRFASLGEFRTHSSGRGIIFEFTTETIGGVNYQFSGKFVEICVLADSEPDPERVVAVGRLLKLEKGKQKAEAEIELTYSKSAR